MKTPHSSLHEMGVACFLLCFQIVSSAVVAQQQSDDIVPGILNIKVTEDVAFTLEQPHAKRSAGEVMLTGIPSLDAVHQRYRVHGMRRVFKPAGSYEIKHRKHGLHLWYEVVIDSTLSVTDVVSAFASVPGITVSEPVYKKTIPGIKQDSSSNATPVLDAGTLPRATNDDYFSWQWHFNNSDPSGIDIDLLYAWELETGNSDVVVAVVDGGIDVSHPDIQANLWRNSDEIPHNKIDDDNNGYVDDVHGYNFVYDRGPIGASYHGTHVAGTVAATTNNRIGVAGVAGGSGVGDGARLMSCQVFAESGVSTRPAEAIVYGADNGAIISQNSWGYDQPDVFEQIILDAIDYFIAEAGKDERGQQIGPMDGGIVIFSAGNANSQEAWYPAFYEPVVAVAATTRTDEKAFYSNFGKWVDITAPGGAGYPDYEGIWSTLPIDDWYGHYGTIVGTSMACSQVSGVAALIASKFGGPGFTPAMLREKLLHGTESIDEKNPGFEGLLGSGRLNAYAALLTGEGLPPDRIEDLKAIGVTKTSVTLEWTTPADPNGRTAYRYELRYSKEPMTEANFFTSGTIVNVRVEALKGMKDTLVIEELNAEQTYYFALVSYDFYGHVSGVSNILRQTTLPTPVLHLPTVYILDWMQTAETRTYSFPVVNLGGEPLTFRFVKLEESEFATLSQTEGIVPPHDTLELNVTFRSYNLAENVYDQSYEVENNGDNPTYFLMQMVVTNVGRPILSVPDTTIDFENGSLGVPKGVTLKIHNDGTEPLIVTDIASEEPVFTTSFTDSIIIKPFKDARVRITFRPKMQKDYNEELIIQSNDPKRPTTYVRLTGKGVLPPDIEVSPTSVRMSVYADQKASSPLLIKNRGRSDLEFSVDIDDDTARIYTVLILASDVNPTILLDLFKGDKQIKAELFPRDSIREIKLRHLIPYDVVFVNSGDDWGQDGTNGSQKVIGDLLADYVDQGGKVILNFHADYGPDPQIAWASSGRFNKEEYGPFRPSLPGGCQPCYLDTVLLPGHPLMKGITYLQSLFLGLDLELTPGAIEIARWSGGFPFIAVKGTVVAVNTIVYPWQPDLGEFPLLYQNAVRWLLSSFMLVLPAEGIVAAGEQKTIDIRFDLTGMNRIERHERTVMIHHNVPRKKSVAVPVTLDALGPVLTLSPDSVKVTLDSVRTGTQAVILRNNSSEDVTFSVRIDSATYMHIAPASGTIPGRDSISLTIDFDARSLDFGVYVDEMIFSMEGREALTVPVILSVTDEPEIEVYPLALQATVGFREDTVQHFEIVNNGGSPLKLTIDVDSAAAPNPHVGNSMTLLENHFEGSVFPPQGWEVVDNLGYDGEVWRVTPEENNPCLTGRAASMADDYDSYQHDTELVSPMIFVQGYKQVVLEFAGNNQGGQLDVDILLDGKLPWKNILHWGPGHGSYEVPCESVSILLDSILADADHFRLRWRNYYLNGDQYLSTQIDDVLIKADAVEWLTIESGTDIIAPGDTARIKAIFHAEDLEPRSYHANILISSNAVNAPAIKMSASLDVLKPASLQLKPDSMYQTLSRGDSITQVLTISNPGESPLRFSFDERYMPGSAPTATKQRRFSVVRRDTSMREMSKIGDMYAIRRSAFAPRVRSAPSIAENGSAEHYSTGFEELYPGELDQQEGWLADPGVWSIESANPFGGSQHLRGVSDFYGYAVTISPHIEVDLLQLMPVTSVTMQVNLDSALRGEWQIVFQSQDYEFVATRIKFTPEGTMQALVWDSLDVYNAFYVDVPVVLPKGYFELRMDLQGEFTVYINNEKVFTGMGYAPVIEEVAFLFYTDIPGTKFDVDNLRIYEGLPPLTWVRPEPASGIIPGGESLPINIHLNAFDLGAGTYHHALTFTTNDPVQTNAVLPVTLRVSAESENDAPAISSVRDTSVVQTTSLALTFMATDPDSVVSVVIMDAPSFARRIEEGSGYATYQFNPTLTDETGTYDLTLTATDTKGNSSSLSFTLTVLQYGIKDFSVIDLRTGTALAHFEDSISIDAGREDFRYLTIRANTQPETVGSVSLRIDDGKKHVENKSPYVLPGYFLHNLTGGVHVLHAEAFTTPLGHGVAQQYREAILIVRNDVAVSGFEVVNQYGDRLQELRNGDVLDVGDPDYEWMNVRALLTEEPPSGSVRFYLNEAPFRVENQPPYIMVSGIRKWWSTSGSYTVEARPFSRKNGNGIPGKSQAVTFTIADSDRDRKSSVARENTADKTLADDFTNVYPIPTRRFIHVSVYEDMPGPFVQLVIRDVHSQVLFNETLYMIAQPFTLDLAKMGLSEGIYYLQIRSASNTRSIRFVKE